MYVHMPYMERLGDDAREKPLADPPSHFTVLLAAWQRAWKPSGFGWGSPEALVTLKKAGLFHL